MEPRNKYHLSRKVFIALFVAKSKFTHFFFCPEILATLKSALRKVCIISASANTMVDLPNTMVDLPNTMVDLPNTMVYFPNTIVDLPNTIVDLVNTTVDLPYIMVDLPNTRGRNNVNFPESRF